jgi:hypothetical protein
MTHVPRHAPGKAQDESNAVGHPERDTGEAGDAPVSRTARARPCRHGAVVEVAIDETSTSALVPVDDLDEAEIGRGCSLVVTWPQRCMCIFCIINGLAAETT